MLRPELLARYFACFAVFLVPAVSSAQTVAFVSGNGQLVCAGCPALSTQNFEPLVVSVTDSSGAPMVGTTVNWSAVISGGTPKTATSTTDATGHASYTVTPAPPLTGLSYTQTMITATAGASSVLFTETTVVPSIQTGFAPIQVILTSPTPSQALTGTPGSTSPTPAKVQVLATQAGLVQGLQGIALQVNSGTSVATLSCMSQPGQQPGTVLTDSTGTATCPLVFGPNLGSGTYQVVVGATYASFSAGGINVTPGPPAVIKIISGNNQSVNPGAPAPMLLTAEVTDLAGNASDGATVSWSVTQGTATLTNSVTSSPSSGVVSTRVVAGSSGPIQVTAKLSGTTAQVVFTLNVNTVVTQLQILSGNNQSIGINLPFTSPLIVQVNDGAAPVAGASVAFALASGSATLSASSATTDAQGQAQITVTAGATMGLVTITAQIGTFTQTFSLTVQNGPNVTASGFTNGAGFQVGSISPCSLATIFGQGLATGIQGVVTSFLEPQTQVAGVTVQFGNAFAPILSVVNQNGQESVTVQVPCETVPGTVSVVVTAGGGSTTVSVTVLPISPGIFQTTMSDGQLRAVLVRPDGSFVSLQNPARVGEIIRMYATGLGQTSPPIVTNQVVPLVTDASGNLTPEAMPVSSQVIIGVNNAGVQVVSAQYAYGMVGVYEVQFKLESADTGNDIPFAILMFQNGEAMFGNPSAIPVQ